MVCGTFKLSPRGLNQGVLAYKWLPLLFVVRPYSKLYLRTLRADLLINPPRANSLRHAFKLSLGL